MKKLLAAMFFALSAFLLVSCGGEEEVKCESSKDQEGSDLICPDKNFTICATESGDRMWFKVDGREFKCKGGIEDCDDAFEEFYNYCTGN